VDIRDGLQFHPVSTMDEVLALALRDARVPAQPAMAQPIAH